MVLTTSKKKEELLQEQYLDMQIRAACIAQADAVQRLKELAEFARKASMELKVQNR